ncbi:MAG: RagB/SusD family nutrient uptake outer membrane protein [Porphyromonas sp.]|nr:RagB/SusD family nutrient uptake outer membrane protein [Porphyromonas sp.]
MKVKNIKSRILAGASAVLLGMGFTSCDFLNLKPLDEVSPDQYYLTAEQLGGFTINYYTRIFPNNSFWGAGVATFDNGTDNQANLDGNTGTFLPGRWKVPSGGGIGFNNIRNINKFINETEAKIAEGKVSGSEALINQYLGEAYIIRGLLYYSRLKTYGDYPIILEELNLDADLVEASKRMPRNEVARQILKDFDKAIPMLQETFYNNQRINKRAALTLKSRIALYEATFEKYHAGSGRVPGDANWPGKDKEWNKGKTFDQAAEVKFFLTEAMKAAKEVADKVALSTVNTHVMNPSGPQEYYGWNPYYQMFADPDLGKYPEVLLWRQFNTGVNASHLTSNKLRFGSATGWTRGLVESFLMKNGLPIYASGSGYLGDRTIDITKTDRDERLQLFVFGETDLLAIDQSSINEVNKDLPEDEKVTVVEFKAPTIVSKDRETRDITGYRQRKLYNYDVATHQGQVFSDVSGQIMVRVEEAYLNYIEASYLLNNTIDATADRYWKALRTRAGITAPISVTISATDMSYEADVNRPSYDWGAFSAGEPIDATLYSIRRERRSEFAGEGYRWDDLVRWASLEQVKDYHIEGINLWDEMYTYPQYKTTVKDENGNDKIVDLIIADGSDQSTVSSKEVSKYLRPYQIFKNGELVKGYTFSEAHYLSPFSFEERQLTSPTGDVKDSYLYQNIYWPINSGMEAEK